MLRHPNSINCKVVTSKEASLESRINSIDKKIKLRTGTKRCNSPRINNWCRQKLWTANHIHRSIIKKKKSLMIFSCAQVMWPFGDILDGSCYIVRLSFYSWRCWGSWVAAGGATGVGASRSTRAHTHISIPAAGWFPCGCWTKRLLTLQSADRQCPAAATSQLTGSHSFSALLGGATETHGEPASFNRYYLITAGPPEHHHLLQLYFFLVLLLIVLYAGEVPLPNHLPVTSQPTAASHHPGAKVGKPHLFHETILSR